MGYHTRYELDLDGCNLDGCSLHDVIEDFRNSCEGARYALDGSGDCYEASKWYSREGDLIEFSKKYPNIVFTLNGEGEENKDIWNFYVKNGKHRLEKAVITIKPFNEDLLL